jgi:hypothetical protein
MRTGRFLALLTFFIGLQLPQVYAQKLTPTQPQIAFKAGSWQVGLKEGYGRGDLLRNRNSLQVHSGYYLVNRLLVGLNGTWSKEWVGDFNYHDLSAGPYLRYHFTSTRISPFIDASYQIGQRKSGSGTTITYPKISMQTTQITPGINFGLINSLRLEISYGLQWAYLPNGTQSFGQTQVGLTYLFADN